MISDQPLKNQPLKKSMEPTHNESYSKRFTNPACMASALGLAVFAFLVFRMQFLCDDAYISFRYAFRLASGLGVTFNEGATPPVEGYTEFLWVVLMGLAERIRVSPEIASQCLSIASGVGLWVLARNAVRRHRGATSGASLWVPILVGGCVPLAVWSTSGMGTMAFVLASFAALDGLLGYGQVPRVRRAAFAACMLVLLRADGALWVALIGTLGFLCSVRLPGLRRASWIFAGTAATVFAAHILWRWQYYGDWLPNTARAKVSISEYTLSRGLNYVFSFGLVFPGLLALWLSTPILGRKRMTAYAWVLWLCVPSMSAYSVLTGGDFMCFGRFLLPALVPLILAFALVVPASKGSHMLVACVFVAGLLPAWDQHLVPSSIRETQHFRYNAVTRSGEPLVVTEFTQWKNMKERASEWAQLGRAIAFHTEPQDSVVIRAAGAIGYFSQRRVFDRHGLVSKEVLELPRQPNPPREEWRSPGHDLLAPAEFFRAQGATWRFVRFMKAGQTKPRGFRPGLDRWIPLAEEDGFELGAHLLLVGFP